jgi:hypothetical protein
LADYTKYPNQIDTTSELPISTDLVTPVKAEVPNRLRDAIVAMQNEMGIQPSGTESTIRARLDNMDNRIILIEQAVAQGGGGGGGSGDGLASKVRVYRSTNQSGSAVTVAATVSWNSTSARIASLRSTVGATTIAPEIEGNYLVSGQLTISPTVDSITGVTIQILSGVTTIHQVSDLGAIWGVGLQRTIPFSFLVDLAANAALSVQWTHTGSASSTTQLVSGDNLTWFAFSRVSGLI